MIACRKKRKKKLAKEIANINFRCLWYKTLNRFSRIYFVVYQSISHHKQWQIKKESQFMTKRQIVEIKLRFKRMPCLNKEVKHFKFSLNLKLENIDFYNYCNPWKPFLFSLCNFRCDFGTKLLSSIHVKTPSNTLK